MKIVNIEIKDGYLYAAIEGEYRKSQDPAPLLEIIEQADKANLTSILIDCRNLTGDVTFIDRYDAATMLAQFAHSRYKIAFLAGDAIEPDDGFFENVAVNRGMNVMSTVDYDEAVKWLRS